MSLASTIGEAGVAFRFKLGRLRPKMISTRLLRLDPPVSGKGLRRTDAGILLPFAQQVFMDLQIPGRRRPARMYERGEPSRP
jgi:hypothetical protein